MYRNNFCAECGERLGRRSWRDWRSRRFCSDCRRKLGGFIMARPLVVLGITAISFFAIGRFLRPQPPPLLIQRAANSPLSDLPLNINVTAHSAALKQSNVKNQDEGVPKPAEEVGYICGARTKKGTPCHRRVHAAGERCFQHKGMPSLVPESKLVVRP
jgi:hypothetical protein